ncbi:MAG: LPS-assembly protein LptD [Parvularculaceae bacterium]|nr:LPS-assembly protein LptD [Parvularculaceae bacterium]
MYRSRLIARLLATSALVGASGPMVERAAAQDAEIPTVGERPRALPPPAEADRERILFEAETVTREREDSPIVAEGNVRAYFGERYLRADRLSYDPASDIVVAEGNVSITDETLETAFAGRVELTGDLRDGIAENFSAILEEKTRLAADSAVREQGARTRLKNAVYTACDVCDKKGDGKTPTWRVKALRVTRDEERKVVRFHHAFFEIKGVPLLYAPFLQAPDPTVERQSGFLTPLIGASSRLGFNIEVPYYLAISDHQDATFYPKYTSNDGVLWQGEFRRRDDHGYQVVQGGYIGYEPDPSEVDVPGRRWHVFAKGYRDFGDRLRLGYDVERASDDTYLRRYDVQRRGDLRKELDTSLTNRLRSNTYLRWGDSKTELRADSYTFQELRTTTICDLPTGERLVVSAADCAQVRRDIDPGAVEGPDIARVTPYALPVIDFRHEFAPPEIGGSARLNLNFASLQRTSGVDTRRLTASAYWEREHFTPGGHRLNAFAELRGDLFRYEDLNEGAETRQPIADDNRIDGRFAPTVGVEWSYPLTRRVESARLFIEPRVQLVASPSDRNDASIINEDSQSIEFDYAGLFEYNKSTGFDAFEDGQRMNAGVAAAAVLDNGITLEGEIGQQFRLQESSAFDRSTGLGDESSDYVGSLNIRYKNIIGVENRFRIADDDGALKRAESMIYLNYWRFRGNASYVRLDDEVSIGGERRREELNARMNFKLTKNWYTGVGWRENLEPGTRLDTDPASPTFNQQVPRNGTIRQDFILGYEDECSLFELTYRRDRTQDQGLEPDEAFLVRFTLRSLVN